MSEHPWNPTPRVHFARGISPLRPAARYAVAALLTALATLIHWRLQAQLTNALFLFHYPTTFLVASICGFGPALLAIAGGVVSALAFSKAAGLGPFGVPVLGFIGMGMPISWLISHCIGWHQRTLEELDAKQRQLEAVLGQMPVGIVIAKAPSGELLIGNEHAEKITGRPVLGSVPHPFFSFMSDFSYHADNSPYLPDHCPLARSLRTGEVVTNEEIFILRGDGECRTLSAYASPIKDARGQTIAGVMAFFDISHQKRVERALRESKESYRLAIEGSNGATWEIPVDSQGRFQDTIRISPRLKEFIGFGEQEFPNRLSAWQQRIHPDDLAELKKKTEAHARGELPYHHVNYRIQHRDGSWRWISSIGRLFHAPDGRPTRWTGIDWDITERKRAEEDRLRALRHLDLGSSFVRGLDDRIITWTTGCTRLYGYTAAQAIGSKAKELLKTRFPVPFELIQQQLMDSGNWSGELQHTASNGQVLTISSEWVLYRNRKGEPTAILQTNIDITERKKAEEELQRAIQVRNDIMAVISHDLKNPLAAIDLNATLLQKATGAALRPDLVLGRTRTIKQAAQRALRLIADLLDISRIESGHFQIRPAVCDPSSLFRSPLDELRTVAEQKGARLLDQIGLPEERVVCDPDRISQVISNIVANAIKFVPDRGGEIRITAESTDDAVIFSILDNGSGITPEDLPHVFDRFWHARQSKKAGAGLGLSIARGIIEAHEGNIWVESQIGHGTRFYFTIPKALSPAGRKLLEQASQPPPRHLAA